MCVLSHSHTYPQLFALFAFLLLSYFNTHVPRLATIIVEFDNLLLEYSNIVFYRINESLHYMNKLRTTRGEWVIRRLFTVLY